MDASELGAALDTALCIGRRRLVCRLLLAPVSLGAALSSGEISVLGNASRRRRQRDAAPGPFDAPYFGVERPKQPGRAAGGAALRIGNSFTPGETTSWMRTTGRQFAARASTASR